MAIARTGQELRRWNDLGALRYAIAMMPDRDAASGIGLADVAQLCAAVAECSSQNAHDVRDTVLTIGCEWNLDRDRLEHQSDECLRLIASFVLGPRLLQVVHRST